MRHYSCIVILLFIVQLGGCNSYAPNRKKPAGKDYQAFDRAIELLAKSKDFNEATSLLIKHLNKYPEEGRWAYLFVGYAKLAKLIREMEKSRGFPTLIIDPQNYTRNSNPWYYNSTDMKEVYHWYMLAEGYEHSQIEAYRELFLHSLLNYSIHPSPRQKERLFFYGAKLRSELPYSEHIYVLRTWLDDASKEEDFTLYDLRETLEKGWNFSEIAPKYGKGNLVEEQELFKIAEKYFKQNDFDRAIEYYKYAAYGKLWAAYVSWHPMVFGMWFPEDGEDPNGDEWIGIAPTPLALNKISECYKKKAKMLDSAANNLSRELVKTTKIEYYKTSVFYYWLACFWQNKLLETNKKQIADLRQKLILLEQSKPK